MLSNLLAIFGSWLMSFVLGKVKGGIESWEVSRDFQRRGVTTLPDLGPKASDRVGGWLSSWQAKLRANKQARRDRKRGQTDTGDYEPPLSL
jgi:hypothetical protein